MRDTDVSDCDHWLKSAVAGASRVAERARVVEEESVAEIEVPIREAGCDMRHVQAFHVAPDIDTIEQLRVLAWVRRLRVRRHVRHVRNFVGADRM